MADPISIIPLVEGSVGLILQCGSTIKSLNDIAGKYKHAELTLRSIIQEVDIIELAWKRIKDWFESYTNETGDVELLERLDKSLKCGTNVISALQDDLLDYGEGRLGIMRRSRLAWNENALRDHQYRIRGQVQAMSLLLQVMELPTSKARSKQLHRARNTLLKSDESAYSIVPSRMSISSSARNSVLSVESAELIDHRWSFEGDLLGARVYKRTYVKNLLNAVLHSKVAKAKDGAYTMLANDAVSTSADDELEAPTNAVLGANGDDAPGTNVEQGLVPLSNSECSTERSWSYSEAEPDPIEPRQTGLSGGTVDDAPGTNVEQDLVPLSNSECSTEHSWSYSEAEPDPIEPRQTGLGGGTVDDAPGTNVEQGLVLLSEEMSKDSECYGEFSYLDFVAISGPIEEPQQTWTHPKTRHLWLRDSLPKDFISARIFTFNYSSYLLLSDEIANIESYAEKLLSELKTVGAGYDNRRIVFIAHSYGGFLCKRALVLAKNDLRYSDIVKNATLFCFFGTPSYFRTYNPTYFQPSDLGDIMNLYLKGLGTSTFSGRARSTILETLKKFTGSLFEGEPQWSDECLPLHVLNLQEWDETGSVGRRIVHEDMIYCSADRYSVRDSYTRMYQFESEEDAYYRSLVRDIGILSRFLYGNPGLATLHALNPNPGKDTLGPEEQGST
ncbi:hypothetical protein JMJ35_008205 [Cladonia borealis]|uniref:DUF676 domain-containing protein n=1 Tax=Cladonia borealis TaxID=184061 RepID=A0AA39QXU8_9LECA|nr:hypothetical protein JMJ35_008205 [Cladonia borealis]